ncbi:MAG: bifunctional phosphoribosyl-AMP cyclohydrolase/phosphoribosyl-ATP diphosphatase HisIE [Pseudomonadota bacterium]
MIIDKNNIDALDWAKGDGLLPAVVQHATEGRVLMLGYMNADALDKTLATGKVTFFSRSKQRLWTKGETSNHVLELVSISGDCDRDTLLVQAIPHGPTCHTGDQTCFGNDMLPPLGLLGELESVIQSRANDDPASSYTARLLNEGVARCAQKVGEEGVEVALAAVQGKTEELNNEAADLLYHLLVCLRSAGSSLDDVLTILAQRRK